MHDFQDSISSLHADSIHKIYTARVARRKIRTVENIMKSYLRTNTYKVEDEAFDSGNSDLWIVGLGVFFLSQILINLGQNVVRLSHTKKSRFLWWMGLAFFLVGNMGSFSALNIAPQSTLEGLGAVQFLSNLIFAYRVLGEQILVRHAVSTSLIIAGNVLLVTFGSHTNRVVNAEETLLLAAQPFFVGYVIVTYSAALLMQSTAYFTFGRVQGKFRLSIAAKENRSVHPAIYAIISAMIGGNSVLLGKSCISLIGQSMAHGGDNQRLTRTPGQPGESDVITVAVILWIIHTGWWSWRLNLALKRYSALLVIPVLQAIWIIGTVLSGGIFFEEFRGFSTERSCIFGSGLALVLAGVLALCRQSPTAQPARGVRKSAYGFDIWLNRPMSGRHCAANCEEGLELVRLDRNMLERNPVEEAGLLVEEMEGRTSLLTQQQKHDVVDLEAGEGGRFSHESIRSQESIAVVIDGKRMSLRPAPIEHFHMNRTESVGDCTSCTEVWDRPIGKFLGINAILGSESMPSPSTDPPPRQELPALPVSSSATISTKNSQ